MSVAPANIQRLSGPFPVDASTAGFDPRRIFKTTRPSA
jgi:hypothetical protein